MAAVDLFEKLTLTQVARWLDLHPFELARVIGSQHEHHGELRFSQEDIDRLRDHAGVETWWTGDLPVSDDVRGRALVRSLAALVVEHSTVEHSTVEHSTVDDGSGSDGWETRADNLYRGLEPADQWVVRRAINQLIREGVLHSVSRSSGLHISLGADAQERLGSIADGSEVPESLEALWS